MAGRPTDYNEDIASYICSEIASGRSLRSICEEEACPHRQTVFKWLSKYTAFNDQYAKAQKERTEAFAEDILDIADQYSRDEEVDHINRARLRIDTRKWLMSKMSPKRFGEKQEIEHSGNVKHSLTEMTDDELARIATASSK